MEPHSKHESDRTIALSDELLALLHAQRAAQRVERLRAGALWSDLGYVFATETGTPVDGRNLLRSLAGAGKKAGLPHVTIHDLRHAMATFMLAEGCEAKTVSDTLGHKSVAFTLDVYAHPSSESKRAAMREHSATLSTLGI
ncbi:MAG TPA: tyrosine-type recombinase/integrase [Nocardioidaceae bacterium]|nr:tyrosine-type recombinase/integrase [Nocardioidaceae bacterium]